MHPKEKALRRCLKLQRTKTRSSAAGAACRPKLAEEYKEKVRALRRVSRQPVALAAPSGTPEDPEALSVRRRPPARNTQLQIQRAAAPRPQSSPLDTAAFHALTPKAHASTTKDMGGTFWGSLGSN
jgi:hypothetical protein